jgi:hypothetical protein
MTFSQRMCHNRKSIHLGIQRFEFQFGVMSQTVEPLSTKYRPSVQTPVLPERKRFESCLDFNFHSNVIFFFPCNAENPTRGLTHTGPSLCHWVIPSDPYLNFLSPTSPYTVSVYKESPMVLCIFKLDMFISILLYVYITPVLSYP